MIYRGVVLSQRSKSHHYADIAQLAERQISNLNVAGSMPVSAPILCLRGRKLKLANIGENNMTLEKNVPWFSEKFFSTSVGFDDLFEEIHRTIGLDKKISNYPPYNIRRLNDSEYVIEIAVAGFSKSDLNITIDGNVLKVTGSAPSSEGEYLHKGIAERAFSRTFTLAEYVEVKSADIINGILLIKLSRNIPEEKKPRVIAIGDETTEPQLLNETKKLTKK
jgi:molecular chaperone IbpA